MFDLFQRYRECIGRVSVARYESIGNNLFVDIAVELTDGSSLEIRQAVIGGTLMKYSYFWSDGLRMMIRRWDNRDHWPEVATRPHHCHVQGKEGTVEASPEGGDLDRILARIAVAIHEKSGK